MNLFYSIYHKKKKINSYFAKKQNDKSGFFKDSYPKLNRNSAHKTKLPEEEKNKALFRVVIFMQ